MAIIPKPDEVMVRVPLGTFHFDSGSSVELVTQSYEGGAEYLALSFKDADGVHCCPTLTSPAEIAKFFNFVDAAKAKLVAVRPKLRLADLDFANPDNNVLPKSLRDRQDWQPPGNG